MRKRILLVSSEVELRARFACGLQSAGYAVELACDENRALKLTADGNFHAAIVAPGSNCASLALMRQLCEQVPEMIVLAEGPDELAHWRRSLTDAARAFFLKTAHQSEVISRIGEVTACADNEASPASNVVCIDDCRLDFAGRVFIDASGREVTLTRAESDLLKELAGSPSQVLSRE